MDARKIVIKAIADEVRAYKLLIDNPQKFWCKMQGSESLYPAILYPHHIENQMNNYEEGLRSSIFFGLELAEKLGYIVDAKERYHRIEDKLWNRKDKKR